MDVEKIKILFAEDQALVRQGICVVLQKEKDLVVVGEAGDGEEAVRLARELKPDVVIMDISMPKLDGIEATRQIKAFQPSATILILTAYDYDQYVSALLEAGAAGYLLKGINFRQLIDGIRAVHRGESVLHPVIARKVLERFKHSEGCVQEGALSLLTQRELDVLTKAAKGLSNKDIAKELFLSAYTVGSHLQSIFNKFGVGSRIEAVIQALKRGWLTLDDLS
jgi:NarL family two-component system response regulator LiaR